MPPQRSYQKKTPYAELLDRKKRILEIGPLDRPIIVRGPDEENIFYADIRPLSETILHYRGDPGVEPDRLAPIDFVLEGGWRETFAGFEKFDYVISSHVLEHVPRLLRFFHDVAGIIAPGGFMGLTVPDCRYSFDVLRTPTNFAEVYEVFQHNRPFPSARVLDYLLNRVTGNRPISDYWDNPDPMYFFPERAGDAGAALKRYGEALGGKYIDCHFSVFTPRSFLALLYDLLGAGLFPFECADFWDTQSGRHEFSAMLRLAPRLMENDPALREAEMGRLLEIMRRVKP